MAPQTYYPADQGGIAQFVIDHAMLFPNIKGADIASIWSSTQDGASDPTGTFWPAVKASLQDANTNAAADNAVASQVSTNATPADTAALTDYTLPGTESYSDAQGNPVTHTGEVLGFTDAVNNAQSDANTQNIEQFGQKPLFSSAIGGDVTGPAQSLPAVASQPPPPPTAPPSTVDLSGGGPGPSLTNLPQGGMTLPQGFDPNAQYSVKPDQQGEPYHPQADDPSIGQYVNKVAPWVGYPMGTLGNMWQIETSGAMVKLGTSLPKLAQAYLPDYLKKVGLSDAAAATVTDNVVHAAGVGALPGFLWKETAGKIIPEGSGVAKFAGGPWGALIGGAILTAHDNGIDIPIVSPIAQAAAIPIKALTDPIVSSYHQLLMKNLLEQQTMNLTPEQMIQVEKRTGPLPKQRAITPQEQQAVRALVVPFIPGSAQDQAGKTYLDSMWQAYSQQNPVGAGVLDLAFWVEISQVSPQAAVAKMLADIGTPPDAAGAGVSTATESLPATEATATDTSAPHAVAYSATGQPITPDTIVDPQTKEPLSEGDLLVYRQMQQARNVRPEGTVQWLQRLGVTDPAEQQKWLAGNEQRVSWGRDDGSGAR